MEIYENDLLAYGGSPAEVRRIAGDLGLAIVLYRPLRDFAAMPEPMRNRNPDRTERKFDVMEALGTKLILVCSNVQTAALDDPARAASDLGVLAERAAARGAQTLDLAAVGGRDGQADRARRPVARDGAPAPG